MGSDGGGAYVSTSGQAYSAADELEIRDMAVAMVAVGKGKRADLVAQAAVDAAFAIWGWCGATQKQAIQVLTAQASQKLPHQN